MRENARFLTFILHFSFHPYCTVFLLAVIETVGEWLNCILFQPKSFFLTELINTHIGEGRLYGHSTSTVAIYLKNSYRSETEKNDQVQLLPCIQRFVEQHTMG